MRHPNVNQPAWYTIVVVLVLTIGAAAFVAVPTHAQDVPLGVYSIKGTVVDTDNAALDEATVVLTPSGGGDPLKTSTDAAGSYTLEGLGAGAYNMSASHACCLTGFGQANLSGTTLQQTVDFMLVKQEAPRGTVVKLDGLVSDEATGDPLPYVRISISNWFDGGDTSGGDAVGKREAYPGGQDYQWFEAVTGEDGTYGINVNSGQIELWVDHEGYDYARGSFQVANDTTIDIPMRAAKEGSVVLSGVLRSTDGTPIADGWINVNPDYRTECHGDVCTAYAEPGYYGGHSHGGFYYEPRNSPYASTSSAKDGSWRLVTEPGQVVVSGYHWENYLPAEERLTLEEGENRTVDLELTPIPPDSVLISGRIVDAEDGKPIALVGVSIENQQWGAYNWTQTDEDGRYSVMGKPGFTIVQVHAERYYWMPCYDTPQPMPAEEGASSSAPSRVAPCEQQEREHGYYPRVASFMAEEESSRTLDFELARFPDPDATIQGWVINATSEEGVPGVMVTFFNERTRDWGQAETDQDGSFKIGVHAGYYTVRAYADGYFDAVLNTQVDSGQTSTITISAEPGEKRWGCCGGGYYGQRGAYAVSEDAATSSSGSTSPSGAPAPSMGADGEAAQSGPQMPEGPQVYQGEGGGLGPYGARGDDSSPTPGVSFAVMLVGALAAVGVHVWRRRLA